jgi:DDE superfamily endonuclease
METNGSRCLVTIDGTDCPILEPRPFSPYWYSHKFRGAGLRYEIGVCIQTGWIVWLKGPYPCGACPDRSIAQNGVNLALDPGEMYIADGGYRDRERGCAETPQGVNTDDERMKATARARHEVVNGRIKRFTVLKQPFRHHWSKHGICFNPRRIM